MKKAHNQCEISHMYDNQNLFLDRKEVEKGNRRIFNKQKYVKIFPKKQQNKITKN